MRMLWAAILAAAGLPLVIWASYLLLLALAASGPRGLTAQILCGGEEECQRRFDGGPWLSCPDSSP